ncbi:putative malate permease [Scheffersomyces xylosifermentans]|uniref:putative malate permease n=1 Tax=Scheffersomyces xylosifermentans TaxID=1304137 RepID=UPI00315CC2FF
MILSVPSSSDLIVETENELCDDDSDSTISNAKYDERSNHLQGKFSTRLTRLLRHELIDKFTPKYCVSVMGTGISANILYNFPYPAEWLKVCGIVMFGIASFLFVATTIMLVTCCCIHKERLYLYHVDHTVSVYTGSFVMGYITIVNFLNTIIGEDHPILVWGLWWVAVAFSIYTTTIVVFFSYLSKVNKKFDLHDLDATILLPIVPVTVLSSCGHLITPNLSSLGDKVVTEIFCLMLWCLSIVLAFISITIYFYRLIIYKIPSTDIVFSSWLPIGFLGQSSYSILLFGANMHQLIPNPYLGNSLLVVGCLAAIFLLSFGYFMVFVAVISLFTKIKPFAKTPNAQYVNRHGFITWNKDWWAITFPCGTMSLSNFEISKGLVGNYELKFFKVMSCAFAVGLFLITITSLIGIIIFILKKFTGILSRNKPFLNVD